MPLPPFDSGGNLPIGVHPANFEEIMDRFGEINLIRKTLARRLERIHEIAAATGHLKRFVVFGSFITAKVEPRDLDVFMLMEDSFDSAALKGEARTLFDNVAAQFHFGASVFWLRCLAAWEGEQAAVEYWQATRAGGLRGIVEIIPEAS